MRLASRRPAIRPCRAVCTYICMYVCTCVPVVAMYVTVPVRAPLNPQRECSRQRGACPRESLRAGAAMSRADGQS